MCPASENNINIYFDQPSAQFAPGDYITGKVVLVVNRGKHILGLNMNLLGKAKVTCIHEDSQVARRGHRRLSSRKYSDKYFIIKDVKMLHRSDEDETSSEDHRLSIGTYEYPFTWQLPENIPASFEGPYGWIRYRMEIIVRYSFWDHRCEAEAEIMVLGCYDLRNLDRLYKEVHVENKSLQVYNMYGNTHLELTFELERRAYVPGETVKFAATVDFRNDGGHPPIRGVRVTLIQEQTYKIKDKVKRYFSKTNEIHGPMVFANAIEVWNSSIVVLPLPPTALGGACRLIDVQYYLRANLSISDNDKIDFTTKLQIGTIPVRRSRQNGPPPLALQEEVFGASIEYADRDEMVVPDHSPHINGTAPPNLLDFLAVPPTSSRRASAPLWMETVEIGEPVAGPSSAPPRRHLGGRETRPLHLNRHQMLLKMTKMRHQNIHASLHSFYVKELNTFLITIMHTQPCNSIVIAVTKLRRLS
ncbi:arrestin domain-containing protein 3 isoform X3 [Folsomia candida]|uniref:arrestin domain-containing protein 3 isoform X3 n=1 Tax=Folsomia candida TaxID=158441 RepID=UPI000B9093A3|nr:arrestin domain-containing protein 3 isoform X3 [Folsomia candida]